MNLRAKRWFVRQVISSLLPTVLYLTGCSARHEVVAATETNLGVDIGQTPSTQTPHAKFGYQRVEAAIVPTNRSAGEEAGAVPNGAASNADVIMELRYSGIFSTGDNSGLYQRLAVGSEAVQQPGAAALFIRDNSGKIDKNAAEALTALKTLETPPDIRAALSTLARVYVTGDPATRSRIDQAAKDLGFGRGFSDFVDDSPTLGQIEALTAAAKH